MGIKRGWHPLIKGPESDKKGPGSVNGPRTETAKPYSQAKWERKKTNGTLGPIYGRSFSLLGRILHFIIQTAEKYQITVENSGSI